MYFGLINSEAETFIYLEYKDYKADGRHAQVVLRCCCLPIDSAK